MLQPANPPPPPLPSHLHHHHRTHATTKNFDSALESHYIEVHSSYMPGFQFFSLSWLHLMPGINDRCWNWDLSFNFLNQLLNISHHILSILCICYVTLLKLLQVSEEFNYWTFKNWITPPHISIIVCHLDYFEHLLHPHWKNNKKLSWTSSLTLSIGLEFNCGAEYWNSVAMRIILICF